MGSDLPDPEALQLENLRLREELAALRSDARLQGAPERPAHEEQETLFKAAYDQARHFAGILTPDGIVQHVNRAACAFVGCDSTSVVGKPFWETPWWTHSVAEQQKLRDAIPRAATGATVEFETSSRAADGSLRSLEVALRPAQDGQGRVLALICEGWDITSRRQAEQAAERTRLLLEGVIEQSPVPIVVVTAPDLVVRYHNRAVAEILGVLDEGSYANVPLADVYRRQSWRDFRPDGTPVCLDELPLARALRGEVTRNEELRIERKDGTHAWEMASATPIRDSAGQLVAAVLVFPDITERKEAEAAARQAARDMEWLMKSMTHAFAVWDMVFDGEGSLVDIRFGYFNDAYEGVSGLRLDEVRGKTVREVWPETERSWYDVYDDVARTGQPHSFEMYHKPTHGLYSCTAYRPGDSPARVCVVFEEVTERKRTLERLRQLADEQRTILDTATIGICHFKKRRLHWASPSFLAMLGYNLEEVQGADAAQFYASRNDYERVGKVAYPQLAEGRNYSTEVAMRRKDGGVRWCILSGQAIDPRDVDGGAIWALQDITERRSAEEELRRSEARLEVAQAQAEIGSWELDPVTQTGYWSNEMFRLLGFDPAQGAPPLPAFFEAIHPEDRPRLLEAHERASASEEAVAIQVRGNPTRAPMRHFISNIQAARDASGRPRHFFGTLQDVTARVQAEAAAHEGQERLALALRGADLGSWDWDITTDTVRFDERWTEMLGYGLDEIDPHLRSWERLVHPDDMHDVRAVLDAHLAGQTAAYEVEHRLRHKSGSWVWVLSRGKVIIRDAAGKPLRAVGTHLDVTERRRKDDALRASEHKLSEVVRASPEFIIVSTKAEGRLIEVNPAFAALFGHDHDAVVGRTSVEIGLWPTTSDRARVVGLLGEHGQPQGLETQFRKSSGEVVDVLLSIAPIDLDGQECILILGIDISKRKKAEEALRESARRFERLVQNSSDITAVADAEGRMVSISGPVKTMLGFEPEELVGRCVFDDVHDEDSALARAAFGEAMANPGVPRRVECRFRHKNGDWIPIETVGTSWVHDPLVRGVVLNAREISERKNAESERARLQEQLQQAMKMEAVGRLAGGVAHDFNNLLTVILGFVELAETSVNTADPLKRYLDGIAKAADSAASLTRQLLAFSRRQIIQPRLLSLNDLVENLRPMLGRLIGEDVTLQTVLAAGLGATMIDPGQFDQVLANLAVNARDAMPNGGKLTIETANVDLDESYCVSHADVRPGKYVLLAVSDTGHGMDETVKQRLFEPFFTTKARGRGTGLGLAVIFGIVKQAGGTVEVYSELDRGTTFKVYLPWAAEAAEGLSEPPLSEDQPRGDETVLLVEDEASVRDLAASLLERLGYEVLVAPGGPEALSLAERRKLPIALLLTDVVMPGMNGRELAERFRELHPETRVLYTSGYTEDVIVLHGVLGDHLAFIGKPFSIQALARKVRQVLDSGR